MKTRIPEALLILGWLFVIAGMGAWLLGSALWRNTFAACAALCFIPDWLFFNYLTINPRSRKRCKALTDRV